MADALRMGLALACLFVLIGCGSGGGGSDLPVFDGERAFARLNQQVEIGYRFPGTPAHRMTRDYLDGILRGFADSVTLQPFEMSAPDTSVPLWNIIATFDGTGDESVVLGAHWDTRPVADEDPDPAHRGTPIAGANDGASGVAVLLELARLMSERKPVKDVDLVFFDGEDSGNISNLPWCMGSRFYALSLRGRRPDAAIVVDMIGDRDLQIFMETHSQKYAYPLARKIWGIADRLGVSEFHDEVRHTMMDDHVPLIEVGVPAIVIIDFDYPYWHTIADTPDKCSPKSLEAVGRVLTTFVYE